MNLMDDTPTEPGAYVAYVNGLMPKVADRVILHWDGEHWCHPWSDQKYRGHVYGWIGPLPVMQLEEDQSKEKT